MVQLDSKVIVVDIDDLGKLVHDGSDIVMQPAAENALLALLDLQARVERAIECAKKVIEQQALAYNPNFTGVRSDRIKVGYQYSGAKYELNQEQITRPDRLVITITAPKVHKFKASDDVLIKIISDEFEFDDKHIAIERIEGDKGKLDPQLYVTKTGTTYSPDSKAIDKFIKDNGKVPLGIIEKERSKQITIKAVDKFGYKEIE